ncbi:MAG: hypothetical protein HYW01_13435 [Deltaproteobacteria bacterium]|nr:hypothetical protein [Deltaproteobacteria bacterium]
MDLPNYVKNDKLRNWVQEMVTLCKPEEVHWCDGSEREYDDMFGLMLKSGTAIRLNEKKRPNSYLVRSDPRSS